MCGYNLLTEFFSFNMPLLNMNTRQILTISHLFSLQISFSNIYWTWSTILFTVPMKYDSKIIFIKQKNERKSSLGNKEQIWLDEKSFLCHFEPLIKRSYLRRFAVNWVAHFAIDKMILSQRNSIRFTLWLINLMMSVRLIEKMRHKLW